MDIDIVEENLRLQEKISEFIHRSNRLLGDWLDVKRLSNAPSSFNDLKLNRFANSELLEKYACLSESEICLSTLSEEIQDAYGISIFPQEDKSEGINEASTSTDSLWDYKNRKNRFHAGNRKIFL